MIAIIGNGKGGELIARYLDEMYMQYSNEMYRYEFFDDFNSKPLADIPESYRLVISSSNMPFRRRIFSMFPKGRFINIMRSNTSMLECGTSNIVFPKVHFDYFASIGDNNVISSGIIINHHCKIGSGNLFGTGCLLNGSVTIGNNNSIGSGVIIEPKVKIGDNVLISSGSVIVGDIPSGTRIIAGREMKCNSVYQGNRLIKQF